MQLMPEKTTPIPYHTLQCLYTIETPCLYTIEAPCFSITDVAITPDGQQWVSNDSYPMKIRDTATGNVVSTLDNVGRCMAISPNGQLIAVGHSDNRSVSIQDLRKDKLLHELSVSDEYAQPVESVVFTPDSALLVVNSSGGQDFDIWHLETATHRRMLGGGHTAFSPDGQFQVSVRYYYSEGVEVYEFPEGGISQAWNNHPTYDSLFGGKRIYTLEGAWRVAISPDSQAFALGHTSGFVELRDLQTGNLHHRFQAHIDSIQSLFFSPDRHTLITAGDERIRFWDVQTAEELYTLNGHSDSIIRIALSSDGRTLVSCDDRLSRQPRINILKVWQIPDLAPTAVQISAEQNRRQQREIARESPNLLDIHLYTAAHRFPTPLNKLVEELLELQKLRDELHLPEQEKQELTTINTLVNLISHQQYEVDPSS
jgi:WD40 repeat protein